MNENQKHVARSAEVVLFYEGVNISKDIAPYLISFTYTDNARDKADDISLTLEDRELLWLNDWFPTKGDKIKASIVIHEWDAPNTTQSLPCGVFEVDEIECSGAPNQVVIKAVSTLVTKPMRQEKHTKAWENIKLSTIAADMANKNSLQLFWDSSNDPLFERRDQVEKSDLNFLSELCADYGIALKVSDTKLICYDEEKYEANDSAGSLSFGDKKLINWRFSTKTAGTFKKGKLQYHDHVKNQTLVCEQDDEYGTEGTGRILEINQRADNLGDAGKIIKKKLRAANKKEITGSVTLMGDLKFLGGSNITISGFGNFDGKYVIDKAVHTIGGSYTTKLDLIMSGTSKKTLRKKKKARQQKQETGGIFDTAMSYVSQTFDFQSLVDGVNK